MKKQFILGLLPLIGFMTPPAYSDTSQLSKEASAIAQQFQGQLKPALKKGLQKGGPVHAIEVCHTKAPQIAHQLSQKTGWDIKRVSLKPRGANAKPDKWETAVLKDFNKKLSQGIAVKKLQYSESVKTDGKTTFRYMKAIPTGDVCLKCHGKSVADDVKQALHKLYPNDQATGFSKGQIRGAFSFQKTL